MFPSTRVWPWLVLRSYAQVIAVITGSADE
jgi:hypothetical protein